jgi:hypothetical protein
MGRGETFFKSLCFSTEEKFLLFVQNLKRSSVAASQIGKISITGNENWTTREPPPQRITLNHKIIGASSCVGVGGPAISPPVDTQCWRQPGTERRVNLSHTHHKATMEKSSPLTVTAILSFSTLTIVQCLTPADPLGKVRLCSCIMYY